jgi:hypothetical protein
MQWTNFQAGRHLQADGRNAVTKLKAQNKSETSAEWVRHVVWALQDGVDAEHFCLTRHGDGFLAQGTIIGLADAAPYSANYSLRFTDDWSARFATIRRLDLRGNALSIETDGEGEWFGSEELQLESLKDCLDVDISPTPFTKSLPIRRLQLRKGQSADVKVTHFEIPTFTIRPALQHYECIVPLGAEGGRFNFNPGNGSGVVEIAVDADGIVTQFPGAFSRVWPKE